jgi:hypothetical protein
LLHLCAPEPCHTDDVLALIHGYVPDAKLVEEYGSEAIFALPVAMGDTQNFYQMFMDLDTNLSALNVASYGIADTTLEEVGIRISHIISCK